MTRGNQREIDRQRAQNRAAGKGNDSNSSGGDILKRRENDANALAEKIARKQAAAEALERGEVAPAPVRQGGGLIKKKDGSKK